MFIEINIITNVKREKKRKNGVGIEKFNDLSKKHLHFPNSKN